MATGLAYRFNKKLTDFIRQLRKISKTTYVTLMGISKASERVADLSGEAVALLDSLGRKNEFLDTLVRELVGRRK